MFKVTQKEVATLQKVLKHLRSAGEELNKLGGPWKQRFLVERQSNPGAQMPLCAQAAFRCGAAITTAGLIARVIIDEESKTVAMDTAEAEMAAGSTHPDPNAPLN